MKNRNNHQVLGLYILVLMASIFSLSCETEIPDTDTEPPTFLFRISGDGFDQTFDQDTDFDSFQLNLREDALYDITFSGADSGGVKQIQWQYATDYIEFETSLTSPWTSDVNGLSTFINWYGDVSNPLTGMILAAKIRTNGDLVSHSFNFTIKDFGGTGSMENTVLKSLNIYTGNHDTEVVRF